MFFSSSGYICMEFSLLHNNIIRLHMGKYNALFEYQYDSVNNASGQDIIIDWYLI